MAHSYGSEVPIDNEIDVPLGVKTLMKPTCFVDVECMYFNWIPTACYYDPDQLNDPAITSLNKKVGIRVDNYCVVYHQGDTLNKSGFYRGQVMAIKEGGVCQVQLIDIGPVITVSESKLFALPKEYYNQHRLAIRFGLKAVQPTGINDLEFKAKELLEKAFRREKFVLVLITTITTPENADSRTKNWGHLFVEDGTVADILLDAKLAAEIRPKSLFQNSELYTWIGCQKAASTYRVLVEKEEFRCQILRGAKSLTSFFILKESDEITMIAVENIIHRALTLGLEIYKPWIAGTGNLCLVESKIDGKWYRGRVLMINETGMARVRMVDTGENQDTPMLELKAMPDTLYDISPLAYFCKLPIEMVEREDHEEGNQNDAIACEIDEKLRNSKEDILRRLYQLNEITDNKNDVEAVAWVLKTENFVATVDFKILSEKTTWCTALATIHEVELIASEEILLAIRLEVTGDKDFVILENEEEIATNSTYFSKNQYVQGKSFDLWKREDVELLNKIPTSLTNLALKCKAPNPEDFPEFHYERLEKLGDLKTMKGKTFVFNRLIGFNIVSLIEKESALKKLEELENEIEDWIKTGDPDFNPHEFVEFHQIVLVRFNEGKYGRAKIEEISSGPESRRNPIAFLQMLEFGTVFRCPISELKKPNKRIMNIPELVYFVKIDDVEDDIPVLTADFQKLRTSLGKSCVLFREIKNEAHRFHTVILLTEKIKEGEPPVRLSTAINELAVWKWQKLYRAMHTTYPEISQKYEWSRWNLKKFFLSYPITEILKRASFDMKIQSVTLAGQTMFLSGVPEDTNLLFQDRTVQTQLGMFMGKVESASIPDREVIEYEHIFGVKLDQERLKELEKQKFRTNCGWHRCYSNFFEKSFMCMDCFYKAKPDENGLFPGLTIRPLTPDFYRACPAGMTCEIDMSFLKPERVEAIVKVFFPEGRKIPLRLISRIPKYDRGLAMYYTETPGMKQEIMKNLDPENFFAQLGENKEV